MDNSQVDLSQTQLDAKELYDEIFGDDEVPENKVEKSVELSQTQLDAKDLYNDIFGDSEDEEEEEADKTSNMKKVLEDIDDSNILDDSDDDVATNNNFKSKGRLQKLKSSSEVKKKSAAKSGDFEDSDVENEDSIKPARTINKKRKLNDENKTKTNKASKQSDKNDGNKDDSGDEYDSGEEVEATHDDKQFIDSEDDDEFKGIVREYDEDGQHFDDERPEETYKTKKSKSKKAVTGNDSPVAKSNNAWKQKDTKNLDPLSRALVEMKKPKAQELTEVDKERFVEKLILKMNKACEDDEVMFNKQEPAVFKLQLLPSVQQALSMKSLHQTLLDRDILSCLREWIAPRNNKTLAALPVRTAVYEMLLKLPCLPDHLKRVVNDKLPIGATIVALRKHKMETEQNKKILKEIMDKWSRPIFSKSIDERRSLGSAAIHSDNPEMQEAIKQRYAALNINASTDHRNSFNAMISGQGKNAADVVTGNNRVKMPTYTGFLFTVQPKAKVLDKRDVIEKKMGEERMRLMKKLNDFNSGGGKGNAGKKLNPRAVDLSVNGTKKH
jgi:transcription factor SPN1